MSPRHLWQGRPVIVTDGSSVSMPDTEDNQKLYPQPSGQKKGCGFPVMDFVANFNLATGIMLDIRKGNRYVAERTLWRQMWDVYQPGDVALGDRGFCSLADFWLLSEKGVDSVMRLHQARKEHKRIKEFDKNDRLVLWKRSDDGPQWLTPQQAEEIPQTLVVRHLKVDVDIPGFRTKKIILATTLLDNKKYPAQALADLYRRRWMIELFFRNIKTTMHMEVLRCKSTDMIHKELMVFIIAYNLIRSLIWQAALKKEIDPYRISFAGAIQAIRQFIPLLPMLVTKKQKQQFIEAFMKILAADIVPIPNEARREPRAVKRRPKSYQLLTKPRHEFREIPHREKYRKEVQI